MSRGNGTFGRTGLAGCVVALVSGAATPADPMPARFLGPEGGAVTSPVVRLQGQLSFTVDRPPGEPLTKAHARAVTGLIAIATARGADRVVAVSVASLDHTTLTVTGQPARA